MLPCKIPFLIGARLREKLLGKIPRPVQNISAHQGEFSPASTGCNLQVLPEIADAMEGLVIRVVKIVWPAKRRAHQQQDIVPIEDPIGILKAGALWIAGAIIQNALCDAPGIKIF